MREDRRNRLCASKLWRIWLHAAQYLSEGTMQDAEVTLERRVALALVMPGGIVERVPGGVRECSLLCEQQYEYVDEAG